MNLWAKETSGSLRLQQILGIGFFDGGAEEGVAFILRHSGFVVVPSWICFARLHEGQFGEPGEHDWENVRNSHFEIFHPHN